MQRNAIRLLLLFLAILLLPHSAWTAIRLTPEEQAWLKENKDRLVLWYDRKFPPLEFQAQDGSYKGLAADVLALVEERLGVTFKKTPAPSWPGLLNALKEGTSAIAVTIVRTPEREEYAFFTPSYITIPVVVMTTKTRPSAEGLESFKGQRVAVVNQYAVEKYLRDNYGKMLKIVPVPNIQEGLRDASFGVVDAVVENLAVAAYYIEKEKLTNLRVAGNTGLEYDLRFAVSRKYPLLFSALEKAFADLPQQELEQIREKWIPLAYSGYLSPEELKLLKWVVGFGLALVACLGFFAFLLKKRLKGKERSLKAAEQALLDKNERLDLAMKAANAALWDFYPQIGHVEYSAECHIMLGYAPKEVPERYDEWITLMHPADKDHYDEMLQGYVDGGGIGIWEAEFRMRMKTGQWKWVLEKGQVVEWDAQGKPVRMIGMNVDIHKIKQVQEALQKSEAMSQAIFDQAFNFFGLLDLEGRIVRINQTSLDKLGGNAESLQGRFFWEAPWWQDQGQIKDICAQAVAVARQGGIYRRELWHSDAEGGHGLLDLTVSPFRNEEGVVVYLIPEGRDITEIRAAEKAVKESEQRFKTIFDNAPYAIVIVQRDNGMFLGGNKALLDSVGRTKEEIAAHGFEHIIGISAEAAVKLRKDIPAGGIHNQETKVRTPDARTKYLLYSAVPIVYSGVAAILYIVADITAKKNAEMALHTSEKKYRDIFNNAPIGIFRSAVAGFFVEVNPTLAKMFRYDNPEEMYRTVKNLALDIYPKPGVREKFLDALRESPEGVSMEIEFRRKDNTPLYAIIHASLQKDELGRPLYIDGTIEDITARKKSQEALKASEEKFSRLFHLSPDAIALLHRGGGNVLDVNKAFSELFKVTKRELADVDLLQLGLIRDKSRYETLFTKVHKNGSVTNYEVDTYNSDGKQIVCSLSCQLLELVGEPCILAVFRDITENKRIQQIMVQTEKMLSVGGIAAGVAHEINNPLGIVLQAAQNLAQRCRPDFPKNREVAASIGLDLYLMAQYMQKRKLDVFIQDIRNAAQRASGIIRNMLNFSRRSESRRNVCDLKTIISGAVKLANSDFDLKKHYDFKKIKVEVAIDGDVPQIYCTETEIEQVVLNLLRNAAQAMAEMKPPLENPRIDIRVTGREGWVRIDVADNGPGVPDEIQTQVLEPFFTTKEPGVGTGLGLSVSYFIVTTGHSGRFMVGSNPGGGARFTFELPTEEEREAKQ